MKQLIYYTHRPNNENPVKVTLALPRTDAVTLMMRITELLDQTRATAGTNQSSSLVGPPINQDYTIRITPRVTRFTASPRQPSARNRHEADSYLK